MWCLLLCLYVRDAGVRGGHALALELGCGSRAPRLTERRQRGQRRTRERALEKPEEQHWTVHLGRYSLIPEFMRPLPDCWGGGGAQRRGPHKTREIGDMSHHSKQRRPFLVVVGHSTFARFCSPSPSPSPVVVSHRKPLLEPAHTLGSTMSSRADRGCCGLLVRGGALFFC